MRYSKEVKSKRFRNKGEFFIEKTAEEQANEFVKKLRERGCKVLYNGLYNRHYRNFGFKRLVEWREPYSPKRKK